MRWALTSYHSGRSGPLSRIDHLAVERWVVELGGRMAPASVAKCFAAFRGVMRLAVRSRLIGVDPTEDVKPPNTYRRHRDLNVIARDRFFRDLLPAIPAEHRALVCVAAGAGVRTVPLPDFLVAQLRARHGALPAEPDPTALVFATREAGPLRRSNFRRQVWRPALVRAGLLGKVAEVAPDKWHAKCTDAAGGLRFHDLRHSYATWLISAGVPVNVVQRVMGHEQASTTLNLYVHPSNDHEDDVRDVFGDGC